VRCIRLAVAALALSLAGCASYEHLEWKVLAADPAPDAGFLDHPERMTPAPERTAFDRMWSSGRTDWRDFSKLYVAPVDTSHRLPDSLWDVVNIRYGKVGWDRERQAEELRARVEDAFRDDPLKHFVVLDDPSLIDDDTVVLELSLVELVPNKAVLGAIGILAWGAPLEYGIPVATATAFIAHGSIAIEGDFREARTARVIGMFTGRDIGKMRVLDLRSLTWYGNAYEDFHGWAQTFVALANAERPEDVRHPSYFTIVPW